ncbi:alpha/beta hydrolase fold domain-containing protein [Trichoderma evansii]
MGSGKCKFHWGRCFKGFIIGGAEAGAQIAEACAVRARNRHPNIKITGQNLIVPITCSGTDSKMPGKWLNSLTSHAENKYAVVFDERMFQMFVNALGIPEDELRNGENFPLWAYPKGLPPAYLAMDEYDPFRDHAFLYAELLREAGVLTRTDYYRGLSNMFVHYPQIPDTARAGWQQSAAVRWLLDERK